MSYQGRTLFPHTTRGSRQGPSCDSRQLRLDFEQATTPAAVSTPVGRADALTRFASRFAAALAADESVRFNNAALNDLAREIFGSAVGHARDAYDAAEAGFNLFLAQRGLNGLTFAANCRWLESQDARLPRQNKRDHAQVELQQFSTPHVEAYLVVWTAALQAGMYVLEPSAGTGNIAVLARLAGAHLDTNEIDQRRRELLKLQGFEPTEVDAERLNNLLPDDKTYDAIVMNPPFSATGAECAGMLERLEPGMWSKLSYD